MEGYKLRADALFRSKLSNIPHVKGEEHIMEYLNTEGKELLLDISLALSELLKSYCTEKNFTYEQIHEAIAYNGDLMRSYVEFVRDRMNIE